MFSPCTPPTDHYWLVTVRDTDGTLVTEEVFTPWRLDDLLDERTILAVNTITIR